MSSEPLLPDDHSLEGWIQLFLKPLLFIHIIMDLGFPGSSAIKNPLANTGDMGLIPGSGRSPKKGMATHCSILAWEIPGKRRRSLGGSYSPWGCKESHRT